MPLPPLPVESQAMAPFGSEVIKLSRTFLGSSRHKDIIPCTSSYGNSQDGFTIYIFLCPFF